ncbi:caspase-7-like [Leguminivora glycinivorella]|uniref:caspase-7-like n=1 Tax=Leguminivora glycinivorella TaxID=1035111 RepID=UPI0020106B6A|nr:caspase-7-like [Leguminivora glycinivorella]
MAEQLNLGMECEDGAYISIKIHQDLNLLEDQMNQNSSESAIAQTDPKDGSADQRLLNQKVEPGDLENGQGLFRQPEINIGLLGLSINDNDVPDRREEATINQNLEEAPPPPLMLAPLATPGNVNVIRSTRFMDDLGKEIKLYRTRGRKRGVLILFSYSEFTTGEHFRDVATDNEMLADLFRQIGFNLILPYENKTKQETIDIIKARSRELEGYECVFFVMSSHGYGRDGMWDTEIRCTDGGLVSSHEVVDLFNSEHCPRLAGVPKVFVFQACRGRKLPPELQGVITDVSNFTDDAEARDTGSRGRSYSDILIAHSTLPGFVSPRNEGDNKGSWYKQALCSVFASHAHDHHVLELFQLVDVALKRRCHAATTTVESWGFNKHLYLHPGLVEDADGNPKPMQ